MVLWCSFFLYCSRIN